MIVRAASPADAEVLARIRVASWRAAYRGLLPDPVLDGMDEAAETRRWASGLAELTAGAAEPTATDPFALLGCDAAGQPQGYVIAGPYRDDDQPPAGPSTGEVYALYVEPTAWGRGFGTALIRAAVGRLEVAGYRAAALWVLETNVGARGFYESQGWILDGVTGQCRESVGAPEVRYLCPLAG